MSYEHLRGLMGGTPPHTTPGLPITGVSLRPHLSLVPDTVEDEFESAEVETDQWQDRALCAQTDPEAFFPEKGGSTREAKRICMGCEVRDECLEYALEHDERFGIWGGLSARERRRLKRDAMDEWPTAAAVAPTRREPPPAEKPNPTPARQVGGDRH